MVTFHQKLIDLLIAGKSVTSLEERLNALLNIFKQTIEKERYYNKLEIDSAITETTQAMDLWEYKNPTDAVGFKIEDDNFQSMKKKFEDLLEIEW